MKGVIVQVGEPKSIVLSNNGKITAIPTPAGAHLGMVVTVNLNSRAKILAVSLSVILILLIGIGIGILWQVAEYLRKSTDSTRISRKLSSRNRRSTIPAATVSRRARKKTSKASMFFLTLVIFHLVMSPVKFNKSV